MSEFNVVFVLDDETKKLFRRGIIALEKLLQVSTSIDRNIKVSMPRPDVGEEILKKPISSFLLDYADSHPDQYSKSVVSKAIRYFKNDRAQTVEKVLLLSISDLKGSYEIGKGTVDLVINALGEYGLCMQQ